MKTDSYAVGYKKPPNNGRFQPGKSDNPRGRPKLSPDLEEIVAKLMKRKVTITEGGNSKKISSVEALVRKQFHQALKGDNYSTVLILDLYNQHLSKTETRVKSPQSIDISSLSPQVLDTLEKALLLMTNEPR